MDFYLPVNTSGFPLFQLPQLKYDYGKGYSLDKLLTIQQLMASDSTFESNFRINYLIKN